MTIVLLFPQKVALDFARHMNNQIFFESSGRTASRPTTVNGDTNEVQLRSISDYYTLNDKNGEPALYVINYGNDSGYIVISADFRYEPVCAYSDHGNLYANDSIPSAMGSWFGHTVENIEMLRNLEYDNSAPAGKEWQRWDSLMTTLGVVNLEHHYPPLPDPCVNPIPSVVVQPLLGNIAWGQGCGFNDLCPNLSCNLCNDHAKAGCVAIAMAQVIKYWQYPTQYNYSSMPDNYGNYDVQDLIHHVGESVNMDYGCSESGAGGGFWNWLNGNSVISTRLKDVFDYTTADYDANFTSGDKWTITGNIDAGKPVILGGYTSQGSIFGWHWGTGGGHEWVCDGYKLNGTVCYKHVWFHMNWGWNGYDNGWYYWNDWSVPSVGNFQYCQSFIYNIHP